LFYHGLDHVTAGTANPLTIAEYWRCPPSAVDSFTGETVILPAARNMGTVSKIAGKIRIFVLSM